jgi:hypothetical protein
MSGFMDLPGPKPAGATQSSGPAPRTYADGTKREGLEYDDFTKSPNPRNLIPGTARAVKQRGNGPGGIIEFEAYFRNEDPTSGEVYNEPTPQEVSIVQKTLGYHPAGYGRNQHTATLLEDGRWYVTWSCAASCE